MLGPIITFISLLAIAIVISSFGFIPNELIKTQLSPIQYLLSLFFGFAIAAFQEETIFKGFLRNIFIEETWELAW
ncbi:MAG: hypothetical protein QXF09_01970 [Nitrososphaerota archaeon]